MRILLLCVFAPFFPAFSAINPPELTPQVAYWKAEEMVREHVAFRAFTPEIGRRTVENFLFQLDPNRVYFIEGEVVKWAAPSEELVELVVENYRKRDFRVFQEIYELMIDAIARRNRIEGNISLRSDLGQIEVPLGRYDRWARDEEELEVRLLQLRALHFANIPVTDPEMSARTSRYLAKYRLKREAEIAQSDADSRMRQMLSYFLKAFASSLDDHTAYFTPFEARQFAMQVQQRLVGIGVELRDDLGGFTLVRLIEGGPAFLGGELRVNDRIIAVDRASVVGMDLVEFVERVRGKKGTVAHLTVVREGEQRETLEVEVVRDEVVLQDKRFVTRSIPREDGAIAYMRLFSFYRDSEHSSASDIAKGFEEIARSRRVRGVMLDLRGNMGGVFQQAVEVASLFLGKGIVTSVKDRNVGVRHFRNLEGRPIWKGPLIVLIDRASASAAEIVAQALQDYGRALIVGDAHTWGKGSYQACTCDFNGEDRPNPQGEYKVTRGLYYTVSGRSPQLCGVEADIRVPGPLSEIEIGESCGRFPLKGDAIPPNFVDRLEDLSFFERHKIARSYEKNRQEKTERYREHLDLLRSLSETRLLQHSRDRTSCEEGGCFDRSGLCDGGDLQLEESCNILEDLIFIVERNGVREVAVAG